MILLSYALRQSCPEHLRVVREMSVVLGKRGRPEPDVSVVRDRELKPRKYAEAGIPHFWRVEQEDTGRHPVVYVLELEPATRTYVVTGVHHGRLKVGGPFEIDIDLTEIDRM
ncbi:MULTISPECIES: hypothetical protein [unclassified Kitasatospora]|uniref:hypothetical protein n=1 Tax=unclassified Kitasatospora TaxID=2633591 RepID=UPI0012F9850A